MNSTKTALAAVVLAMALAGCDSGPSVDTTVSATNAITTSNQTIMIQVRFLDDKGQPGPLTPTAKVVKTDKEWRSQLTADQFAIARHQGTEPAFCGAFYDQHKPGVYECVCCGLPLFTSEAKYDSGTGWPSFFQPVARENVLEKADHSYGERTEVLCARCEAHLGHVFDDGPRPTGLRFCMNSASLVFKENKNLKDGTAK
jgi:methionine-R-sulfoxide reductase